MGYSKLDNEERDYSTKQHIKDHKRYEKLLIGGIPGALMYSDDDVPGAFSPSDSVLGDFIGPGSIGGAIGGYGLGTYLGADLPTSALLAATGGAAGGYISNNILNKVFKGSRPTESDDLKSYIKTKLKKAFKNLKNIKPIMKMP